MQFGIGLEGGRIEAYPRGRAVCPFCEEKLIAKCGQIMVHHWAHESGRDCDSWFEPETPWHRRWKARFPASCAEVAFEGHRADVCLNGLVIELQNSPIGPAEIQERERFYGRQMVWVVNASSFAERFFLMKALQPGLFSFRWKHLKPTWRVARRPVILDFGDLSVGDMLGARAVRSVDTVTLKGDREVIERHVVERFHPSFLVREDAVVYKADESLAGIPPEIGDRTLFRINTLHENGCGSGVPLDREVLLESWLQRFGPPVRSD